jgi:hypothetical protein
MPDEVQLPSEIQGLLRAAGWTEGRRVPVDAWAAALGGVHGFTVFPAAVRALEEFGGLRIDTSGPGTDFARTSLELDPTLALGEGEQFESYRTPMVTGCLYPLGEVGHGHAFLAIDEAGHCFMLANVAIYVGESVHSAVTNVLTGRWPRSGPPVPP